MWIIRAWLAIVLCSGFITISRAVAAEPALQSAARSIVGADQGVFAQAADGSVLAMQQADRPVHPASVMKIATTLALFQKLGPGHRFETRLAAAGPVSEGRVHGDLIIEAGGDPVLVDENAFLMLLELHARGIRGVDGALQVQGSLFFNWEPDPKGVRLRRALTGQGAASAWSAVRDQRSDAPAALAARGLAFGGGAVQADGQDPRVLLTHGSPPLTRVTKELNCYSNNIFHTLSDRIGGPAAVQRIVEQSLPPHMRKELLVDNAAGAGTRNRLSPRAAVTIIQALSAELATHGLSLVDVLPVAGVDQGTLHTRLREDGLRGAVVGKTGTYGSLGASALAGVVRTRTYGDVTFAVLNRGVAVPEARRRQDAFVRALVKNAGAEPLPYRPAVEPAFGEARVERYVARPTRPEERQGP
jgi:D-alanyl-D-alanine carboxypeptidase/D-alanyl-D-alanine-endopeptidase (penicillin-binding protein 4)